MSERRAFTLSPPPRLRRSRRGSARGGFYGSPRADLTQSHRALRDREPNRGRRVGAGVAARPAQDRAGTASLGL